MYHDPDSTLPEHSMITRCWGSVMSAPPAGVKPKRVGHRTALDVVQEVAAVQPTPDEPD